MRSDCSFIQSASGLLFTASISRSSQYCYSSQVTLRTATSQPHTKFCFAKGGCSHPHHVHTHLNSIVFRCWANCNKILLLLNICQTFPIGFYRVPLYHQPFFLPVFYHIGMVLSLQRLLWLPLPLLLISNTLSSFLNIFYPPTSLFLLEQSHLNSIP